MYPEIDTSAWTPTRDEQMGSKSKFWLYAPDKRRWLFKEPRRGHGEDWAEKVAAELASLLALPHAVVELARFETKPGIISLTVVPEDVGAQLVHGNELLLRLDPSYPTASSDTFTVSAHTVSRVLEVIRRPGIGPPDADLPEGIQTASDVFMGYLMFDAWIGNTDRHHENWAVIDLAGRQRLSPTYDHGSSLGRNETDQRRTIRLGTKDQNQTIAAYCRHAPSRFFASETDPKPLHPLEVFHVAQQSLSAAAGIWLTQLGSVTDESVMEVINRIPSHRISEPARHFALAMLNFNRQSLLDSLP